MHSGLKTWGSPTGKPRRWVISAGARLPDQTTIRIFIQPKGPVHLTALSELMNQALIEFEKEHGAEAIDAWFTATAR